LGWCPDGRVGGRHASRHRVDGAPKAIGRKLILRGGRLRRPLARGSILSLIDLGIISEDRAVGVVNNDNDVFAELFLRLKLGAGRQHLQPKPSDNGHNRRGAMPRRHAPKFL